MNKPFHYSILRYRHSYLLQEEVNVGLLFFFDTEKRVEFLYPKSLQRISALYHDFSVTLIKKYFRTFQRAAKQVQKEFSNDNVALFDSNLKSYINNYFLPDDASALYFTDLKTGNYNNIQETLIYYFDQFLSEYEPPKKKDQKDERFILRKFSNIVDKLPEQKKDIIQKKVELTTDLLSEIFEYAWKNGTTNLVTPVGFDLQHPEFIKNKACEWQGKLNTLADAARKKNYKFDIIVTHPNNNKDLLKAYKQGLKLIERGNANQEIFEESDIESYSQKILSV